MADDDADKAAHGEALTAAVLLAVEAVLGGEPPDVTVEVVAGAMLAVVMNLSPSRGQRQDVMRRYAGMIEAMAVSLQ